jgi:hypothetical protein
MKNLYNTQDAFPNIIGHNFNVSYLLSHTFLTFLIFVLLFLLNMGFLLYISCVPKLSPFSLLMNWFIYIKKKVTGYTERYMGSIIIYFDLDLVYDLVVFTRDLWSYILILFGVEWVMPQSVLELLNSWGPAIGCGHVKEAWRLAPLCLLWCIWRERNARLFEDVETSMVELRKRLLLWAWVCDRVTGLWMGKAAGFYFLSFPMVEDERW